ncbi:MAG: hypothetical protein ACP5VE_14410 [Chthonomonadales bacterium]
MEYEPDEPGPQGMRRSSKILIVAAGLLGLVLFAVYYPIVASSRPEFSAEDARHLLDGLSDALARKNEAAALSDVAEDALIAGHKVPEIRRLLRQAFASVRDLRVQFEDVAYRRLGTRVVLDATVIAGEGDGLKAGVGEIYYTGRITLFLERKAVPHLLGLFQTYEWKITRLDAPGVPGW